MSQQLVVERQSHFLLSKGDRVSVLDGTFWDRFGLVRSSRRPVNGLCSGCFRAIPRHSDRESLEPRALVPSAFLAHLLFLQLPHFHRRTSGLDVPRTPAGLRHQFRAVHLLHSSENQPGPAGVRSQNPHQPPPEVVGPEPAVFTGVPVHVRAGHDLRGLAVQRSAGQLQKL